MAQSSGTMVLLIVTNVIILSYITTPILSSKPANESCSNVINHIVALEINAEICIDVMIISLAMGAVA